MSKKNNQAPARGPRTVATNRKARHEYFIEETYEAGIALTGTEIKSVRMGRVNLQDGFVLIRNGEAFLMNVHIAQYEQGNRFNHDETRPRKLLLHKQELRRLHSQVTQRGWTIVPLRMYINERGLAKVEIALVRGKQLHDKRATIAKRETERELRRMLKNY
ncbi:SsrA-binding protein SmpB [Litorilinea aerophila]|uniref:SsrA-binding protein n=1 Tax=Litorilinea aerophila TaxID=1204385 RepID=A0A540VLM0_9CHLR|nr:SsrA-binding protein SmpB [Litorilinea aerophila]MCC9074891.1 SsrA-binding protein SmpB [Litorilinea aerophila]OUC05159.1 SsrA-binding protein [Litorilinea aerophila]GIV76881.1 MAG: SsrA-binding protein [Litorilinea sp.]